MLSVPSPEHSAPQLDEQPLSCLQVPSSSPGQSVLPAPPRILPGANHHRGNHRVSQNPTTGACTSCLPALQPSGPSPPTNRTAPQKLVSTVLTSLRRPGEALPFPLPHQGGGTRLLTTPRPPRGLSAIGNMQVEPPVAESHPFSHAVKFSRARGRGSFSPPISTRTPALGPPWESVSLWVARSSFSHQRW